MTSSLFAQYAVIALAVSLSAGYVVQKQWPNLVRAVRIGCAVPMLRDGRAPWVQWIGRAIAPTPRISGEGGCGGCNGCGTGTAQP